MTKKPDNEIDLKLVEDAENPDAWEEPVTVPPSQVPRPRWYGRTKHLELAAKFYVLSFLHRLGAEANLTLAEPDNVDKAKSVSIDEVASQLNPKSAWELFTTYSPT